MRLYSVLKSLADARLRLGADEAESFMENVRKVVSILSPSSRRLLNMMSALLDIAPILGKLRPFTMLDSRGRREWLEKLSLEGILYDVVNMFDMISLAIYSLSPRLHENIGYDRLEAVRKVKVEVKDARLTYANRPKEYYDAVVIGSGAGGAVVAWELARRGFSVALFEAGPEPSGRDLALEYPVIRALKYYWDNGLTFTWGSPIINLPFGKVLGGTVTVNSGTMFRAPEEALGIWRYETGVNVSPSSLDSAYSLIENKLNVKQVPEHLLGGNALVMRRGAETLGLRHGPVRRPLGECVGLGECAFGCPSFGKLDMRLTFIKEAAEIGAHIFTSATVRKVILGNSRAKGIVVEVDGARVSVKSKIVVISAGALNTPRLLRASGISNKNLGQHLHIHPATGVVALMKYKVKGWVGTMQSYYVEDLLPSYKTLLLATFPPPGIGYSAGNVPFEELLKYEYLASIGVQVSDEGTGRIAPMQLLGVASYNLSNVDLDKVKEGVMLAAEVLLAAGAQKVYPPLKKVGPISSMGELKRELEGATSKMFKLSAYHPMSTARMGKDSDVGVVDEKGLVYGYENLYIADASVIPSTTIVNPQLTINALSLMIAQGIAKGA